MTTSAGLRADQLHWKINKATIVDQVSASFDDGQLTGLIGPNGCGKTSLLHLLAGHNRADAGDALLRETPIGALPRRRLAQRMALVEQQSGTDLELTVEQVVALGRIPHQDGWATAEDRSIVESCLGRVAVEHLRRRRWHQLSGGEKQRVHLARALAQQPEVLLLDEPTNHLDLSAAHSLMALVRDLQICSVAAIHDINLAAAYCDRLFVMHRGRLVASGSPHEVLTAELLAEIYGIQATVVEHPRTARPLVIVDGALR